MFFPSIMIDVDYMRMALCLAEKGRETVHPNPMVGAVVVQGGQIIGEGYHVAPGQPHAEVFALEKLVKGTPGVTIYVTLEPCSHIGRTLPCAELLIQKGVSRVVCASVDPDSRVSGSGISLLKKAGVRVEVGLLEEEARCLNEAYFKHRTQGLPFVTLKLAETLDGRIATECGDSKWITSRASRTRVHLLRSQADAILVGSRTLGNDDPSLSVRYVQGRNPAKIVLDSHLQISSFAKILKGASLIVAAIQGVSESRIREVEEAGARVWLFPEDNGRPRLQEVLEKAATEGWIHILIEGGGEVSASALREGLVDRVAFFIAPKVFGSGVSAVGDLGVSDIADAVCLEEIEIEQIGDDILYMGKIKNHNG